MKRLKLSQAEIDKLVVVERRVVEPTVQGHGFNDVSFKIYVDGGERCWQYKIWLRMLERVYCTNLEQRHQTYKDVTCCNSWLSFANFFEWVNKEVGYSGCPHGLELDKDVLIKGNKTYSPEACSFIPQPVNSLLLDSGAARGEWPIGVSLHRKSGRFVAAVKRWGKRFYLGIFDTPEQAFQAYKVAKEAQIKVVANQHKDVLKPAVYESLMNWEIEP